MLNCLSRSLNSLSWVAPFTELEAKIFKTGTINFSVPLNTERTSKSGSGVLLKKVNIAVVLFKPNCFYIKASRASSLTTETYNFHLCKSASLKNL